MVGGAGSTQPVRTLAQCPARVQESCAALCYGIVSDTGLLLWRPGLKPCAVRVEFMVLQFYPGNIAFTFVSALEGRPACTLSWTHTNCPMVWAGWYCDNTRESYTGPRLGHRLLSPRGFLGFPQSLEANAGMEPLLGHYRLLPDPSNSLIIFFD
jgi:hypothetical protein